MESLLQDLRFGLRSLRKNVGLTVVAVVSLGAGIGAMTTIFTWLNSFVLNPLPAVPAYGSLLKEYRCTLLLLWPSTIELGTLHRGGRGAARTVDNAT